MHAVGRFRYVEVPAGGSTRFRGTLVLIHGFPLRARMWDPQLALADRGWRIIAPELRGFGDGKADPPTTSVDDYAADIIDLLDALHVEDAVIGGLSMGGYITFALFRRAPNYFRGMVLADTRAQGDTPEGKEGRKRMLQLLRDKGPSAVAEEMLPKLIGETTRLVRPRVIDQVRDQILSNSTEAIAGAITALMTRPDSTPLLSAIRCPTLIIVGAEDILTPPALSEEMKRAIGGAELVVVPAAGHMSNMEEPSAFNEALARFLEHRI